MDIHFAVKGNRGSGVMRFKSVRKGRMGKVSGVFFALEGRRFRWADFAGVVRDEGMEPGDERWEEDTIAR